MLEIATSGFRAHHEGSVPAPATLAADRWVSDPDFGGRTVHVLEYDRPASGRDEALTLQAITLMQQLANRDVHSPAVRAAAIAVIGDVGDHATPKEIADSIFRFVKLRVTYEHEADMRTPFADFAHYLYDQTLIAPSALLAMPCPEGDCVDFSMLTASLCTLFRLPTAYKTIAADPQSAAYSHVYVVVQLAPGRFYPLDTSNGPEPGAEFMLPAGKKSKLWPNPADLQRRPMIHKRYRSRLGDDSTDSGDSYDIFDNTPAPASVPYDIYNGTPTLGAPTPIYVPPSSPSPGASTFPVAQNSPGATSGAALVTPPSTSPWAVIGTAIANDASALAAPLLRQATTKAPYYITGANGAQVLYDPSTGKTINASGGVASLASLSALLTPQTLLVVGLLIAGAYLLEAPRK